MADAKPTYKDFANALMVLSRATSPLATPRLVAAYGDSDYLLMKVAQVVRDLWQGSEEGQYSRLEAPELNPDRFAEIWEQKSLFDPNPCYVVFRSERKNDLGKLLATIPSSASLKSHLVFLFDREKIPAEPQKHLQRLGAHFIACAEPPPYEMPRFVAGLGRRYGVTLSDDAVQLILESVGSDLMRLDNEVRKVALFWGTRAEAMGAADVAPLVGMVREDHIFQLDHYLLARDYSRAQILLADLLERGETSLALVGLLARHCRSSLHILESRTENRSGGSAGLTDLARRLRLPFNVVKSYTQYVSRVNPRNFVSALSLCVDADVQLKSSRFPDDLLVSRIVLALAAH